MVSKSLLGGKSFKDVNWVGCLSHFAVSKVCSGERFAAFSKHGHLHGEAFKDVNSVGS